MQFATKKEKDKRENDKHTNFNLWKIMKEILSFFFLFFYTKFHIL